MDKCVWFNENKDYHYMTCCDGLHYKMNYPLDNVCPVCGKEIEVKEER